MFEKFINFGDESGSRKSLVHSSTSPRTGARFVSSWRLKSTVSTLLMGYVNIHDWIRLCVHLTKWATSQGIAADACHSFTRGLLFIAQNAVLWAVGSKYVVCASDV